MTAMSAQSATVIDNMNPFRDLNADRVAPGKWTKF